MHHDLDTATELDSDLDLDLDFVFDLESLELFETTPATRPAGEEPEPARDQALGSIVQRLARITGWSRRQGA